MAPKDTPDVVSDGRISLDGVISTTFLEGAKTGLSIQKLVGDVRTSFLVS